VPRFSGSAIWPTGRSRWRHVSRRSGETRTYRPLVRIFSAPGETPFDLAGDTVTEALNRILASVYDGDPIPLQGLVETPTVNEFVRSAALRTFKVLVASG